MQLPGRALAQWMIRLVFVPLLVSVSLYSPITANAEQGSADTAPNGDAPVETSFEMVSSTERPPTEEERALAEAQGLDANQMSCWAGSGDFSYSAFGLGSFTYRLYLDWCYMGMHSAIVNAYGGEPVSSGLGVSFLWAEKKGCSTDWGYPTCNIQVGYSFCGGGLCQEAYPTLKIRGVV